MSALTKERIEFIQWKAKGQHAFSASGVEAQDLIYLCDMALRSLEPAPVEPIMLRAGDVSPPQPLVNSLGMPLKGDASATGATEGMILVPRAELQKIARGPLMPLPDPGAHSWQAYGQRAATAMQDGMRIAKTLLAGLTFPNRPIEPRSDAKFDSLLRAPVSAPPAASVTVPRERIKELADIAYTAAACNTLKPCADCVTSCLPGEKVRQEILSLLAAAPAPAVASATGDSVQGIERQALHQIAKFPVDVLNIDAINMQRIAGNALLLTAGAPLSPTPEESDKIYTKADAEGLCELAVAGYIEAQRRKFAACVAGKGAVGAAATAPEERRRQIIEHDSSTWRAFWTKHAMPSMLPPSCLVCGHAQPDRETWAITHAELPNIVVCDACRLRMNSGRQDG